MTYDLSGYTQGQRQAADQLARICAASGGAVRVKRSSFAAGTSGKLLIEISLECRGIVSAVPGVSLRGRERFVLVVEETYPFVAPKVVVPHDRWAGTPHVQWGSQLCLYAAPSVEWNPSDGMRGLLDRLVQWLRRAAEGNLDPDDQPLHPPVAYVTLEAGSIVVRPDMPQRQPDAAGPQMWVAVCTQPGNTRVDVTEWNTAAHWRMRNQAAEIEGGFDELSQRRLGAAVVLLERDIGFEYPSDGDGLLNGLTAAGVTAADLCRHLHVVASINAQLDAVLQVRYPEDVVNPRPLFLLIGTPSRRVEPEGNRITHLVCWRIGDDAHQLLTAPRSKKGASPGSMDEVEASLRQSAATWVPVFEDRPEVTCRRDADSPASWLSGKRVLVLGCGALGAPAAEICVRANAIEVTVADSGLVTPGILVRQPYLDEDIGKYKAEVLAARLNRIHREQRVGGISGNAIPLMLNDGFDPSKYDLIIDAAADIGLTSRLEVLRHTILKTWPPLLTLIIGHRARRGLVAVSLPGATGGGQDVLRKLGLAAHGAKSTQLSDIAEDFFPDPPRHQLFHPEPGCSEPTFVGSAAETGALAAHLMSAALDVLSERGGPLLRAGVVRMEAGRVGIAWCSWAEDLVTNEESTGYQVRISKAALREMRAESSRGARIRDRAVETGGMLIGAIDDACRCIWIDAATTAPPDSRLSANHFEHGLVGNDELLDYHRRRSGGSAGLTGMWHTHPDGAARPSVTDVAGMRKMVGGSSSDTPRALLLILAGPPQQWSRWLELGEPPQIYVGLTTADDALDDALAPPPLAGPAWSGGYRTAATASPSDPARKRWLRLLAWRPRRRLGVR